MSGAGGLRHVDQEPGSWASGPLNPTKIKQDICSRLLRLLEDVSRQGFKDVLTLAISVCWWWAHGKLLCQIYVVVHPVMRTMNRGIWCMASVGAIRRDPTKEEKAEVFVAISKTRHEQTVVGRGGCTR